MLKTKQKKNEDKKTVDTSKKSQDKKSKSKGKGKNKITFNRWIDARRQKRAAGPWKGVFRDPVKLYLRGVVMGYRRTRWNMHFNRALVKVEDVKTRRDARYYLGHRVLYIYRAAKKVDPRTKKRELRVISGKVSAVHGNNGTVRVNFKPNIPPRAIGKRCRVMLWPHRAPN